MNEDNRGLYLLGAIILGLALAGGIILAQETNGKKDTTRDRDNDLRIDIYRTNSDGSVLRAAN